jgi:hypothetical protein
MLPNSEQIHLAEVFLSGLIERVTAEDAPVDPDFVDYDFCADIRDRLLDASWFPQVLEVQTVVSDYLMRHFGQALDFRAILADPESAQPLGTGPADKRFASITTEVLRRLGGKYAEAAQRLEKERLEAERQEKERLEKERLEAERHEKDRVDAEQRERERLGVERREQERFKRYRYHQYEILRREDGSLWELGRGATSITYKAFDTNLHFPVALKVISSAYLENDTVRQRFLRAARAMAPIHHPNFASVLSLGTKRMSVSMSWSSSTARPSKRA